MAKRKIKISWSPFISFIHQFDFGRFPTAPEFKIEVPEALWEKYCDARLEYEALQKDLVDILQKKVSG